MFKDLLHYTVEDLLQPGLGLGLGLGLGFGTRLLRIATSSVGPVAAVVEALGLALSERLLSILSWRCLYLKLGFSV